MPRRTIPCSRCGTPRYVGNGSLSAGNLVCQRCRRKQPAPYGPRIKRQRTTPQPAAQASRWANRGTTAQRGLGYEHQALRKAKLAALQDGTPCRRCGHPMIHPTRCPNGPCFYCRLDLGHYTDRYFGGEGPRELEHVKCNRAAGTRLRNQLYGSSVGQTARKRRKCEICGRTYNANHKAQRTCGRTCGIELRRRNGTFNSPWVNRIEAALNSKPSR